MLIHDTNVITLKTIVVKVGTNVLSTDNGMIDETVIQSIVFQIAKLKKEGLAVILVSSGAVGAGMAAVDISKTLNKVVKRQVFSAVGQIKLMDKYNRYFEAKGLHCAQVLATKEDFRDRSHYLNMKSCFHALLRDNIIPVVNENDVTSVTELMFTDNDELAGLIASMVNAELLILLTNVDGVFNGNPNHPDSKVIRHMDIDPSKAKSFIAPTKSSFGRGGMLTKIKVAQKLAKIGIDTIIANGKKDHILIEILNGKNPGTLISGSKKVSNVKKWMVFNQTESSGKVIINEGAAEALRSEKTVNSLLFVGVIRLEGKFNKNDIIRIFDEENQFIGLGKAGFSSEKAESFIGMKGEKPLIHYDYLFVDS